MRSGRGARFGAARSCALARLDAPPAPGTLVRRDGRGSGFGVGGGCGPGSGLGSGVGVGVGVGRSAEGGVRPGDAQVLGEVLLAPPRASFAASFASEKLRVLRKRRDAVGDPGGEARRPSRRAS